MPDITVNMVCDNQENMLQRHSFTVRSRNCFLSAISSPSSTFKEDDDMTQCLVRLEATGLENMGTLRQVGRTDCGKVGRTKQVANFDSKNKIMSHFI